MAPMLVASIRETHSKWRRTRNGCVATRGTQKNIAIRNSSHSEWLVIANDAFSIRFGDGLGWRSGSGTLGKEEAFAIRECEKGWIKHADHVPHPTND